jgi:UDP-N-acetylglucosamine--N-acetylmuramyl-(pentapeptide) pyrophosphoryl-undecaprenol N-acetylglucosamine transferase
VSYKSSEKFRKQSEANILLSKKKIVLTGGGTAGHVNPNLALIDKLKKNNFEIYYIGSSGIEKELIKGVLPYYEISAGKLRRYFSAQNFRDVGRVFKGFAEARRALKEISPDVLFSKGGFVAAPVVAAARSLKIPAVIHESDITLGLANKLSAPFASAICYTFPETKLKKGFMTGAPIRPELLKGSKSEGARICKFTDERKPVILAMGGSLGSAVINSALRAILPEILKNFNAAHLTGKNGCVKSLEQNGYAQFEYLTDDLAHVFACADIIVGRAGANSVSEFLALKKPSLLIPLSKKVSRGDQILNANSFKSRGFSRVLPEEELTPESLLKNICALYNNRAAYISKLNAAAQIDAAEEVFKIVSRFV